jgi:hypothetical protein
LEQAGWPQPQKAPPSRVPQISSLAGFAKQLSCVTKMLSLVAALTFTQFVPIAVQVPS